MRPYVEGPPDRRWTLSKVASGPTLTRVIYFGARSRIASKEIGEAATRISDAGRTKVPGLPWKQIVGMRHRIVHLYYDIDADTLWEVAVRDLPLRANLLGAALAALSDDV